MKLRSKFDFLSPGMINVIAIAVVLGLAYGVFHIIASAFGG
jgi:hypothetical protein